jgi:hypothetical protein
MTEDLRTTHLTHKYNSSTAVNVSSNDLKRLAFRETGKANLDGLSFLHKLGEGK